MKTEKVNICNWKFKDKLETIINRNIKEIPYEGKEIDVTSIIEDIMELINTKEYSLLEHLKY